MNVQNQNEARRRAMVRSTEWLRDPARRPGALAAVLEERHVNISRSVLVRLDSYPCCGWFGAILTDAEQFYEFEIHVEEETGMPIVDRWEEVTGRQNMNAHNRGIGAGDGALAIQVLRELNRTRPGREEKVDQIEDVGDVD